MAWVVPKENPGHTIQTYSLLICIQSYSGRPICRYLSASANISVIGQYIGFTDNRKAYRYQLSVSVDKEAHIGSHTDMKITPLFSLNFMILAKETCEKFHFFLVTRAFSIFSCVSFEINFPEWLWCTKLNSYSIFKKTTNNYSYIGIGIGIGRYENFYIGILSVSADKEKGIIGPISVSADMKKSLSVYRCYLHFTWLVWVEKKLQSC